MSTHYSGEECAYPRECRFCCIEKRLDRIEKILLELDDTDGNFNNDMSQIVNLINELRNSKGR